MYYYFNEANECKASSYALLDMSPLVAVCSELNEIPGFVELQNGIVVRKAIEPVVEIPNLELTTIQQELMTSMAELTELVIAQQAIIEELQQGGH